MAKTLRLILGDQLNISHSWFNSISADVIYVLMEVMQEQTYVKHHIQKVVGFFANMRHFAAQLQTLGHCVVYISLDDPDNKQSFKENIHQLKQKLDIDTFEYQLPDEYRLDEDLKDVVASLAIQTQVYDTEHFLTKRNDIKEFFEGKKQYLMETFYRH